MKWRCFCDCNVCQCRLVPHFLKVEWAGVYMFCMCECKVGAKWKGWKTDRNTVLCWECNLAWIKSSFPGSYSICCSLPGNGIFFIFLVGKVFAERNQMRYFFPTKCLSVGSLGRLTGRRRKLKFGRQQGGPPYICPSPKPFLDTLLNWIMTACKIQSPLLNNLPPTGLQTALKWFY